MGFGDPETNGKYMNERVLEFGILEYWKIGYSFLPKLHTI